MDGGYAGNAGAFSGGCIRTHDPEKRSAAAWDTTVRRKCRSIFRRVHANSLSRKTKRFCFRACVHSGNAGASSGRCVMHAIPKNEERKILNHGEHGGRIEKKWGSHHPFSTNSLKHKNSDRCDLNDLCLLACFPGVLHVLRGSISRPCSPSSGSDLHDPKVQLRRTLAVAMLGSAERPMVSNGCP